MVCIQFKLRVHDKILCCYLKLSANKPRPISNNDVSGNGMSPALHHDVWTQYLDEGQKPFSCVYMQYDNLWK